MLDHADFPASSTAAVATAISDDRTAPQIARAARVSSGRLLAGGRELVIEHAGQEYHLRLTRNDKLILTK